MITVFCVWSRSTKYPEEYVTRLRQGIKQHLKSPHRLVCISPAPVTGWEWEQSDGLDGREGCWHKMELFRPTLVPEGAQCLYFDLDVVIVGSLDDMPTSTFGAMYDTIKNGDCKLNSSVLAWTAGKLSNRIWDEWRRVQPRGKPDWKVHGFKGDQEFIESTVRGQWHPLAGVHSYKAGPVPQDTRVVVFHGEPKMTALPQQHVLRRAWEDVGTDSQRI